MSISDDAQRIYDALSENQRAELVAEDAGPWAVAVGVYELRQVSPQFCVTVLTQIGEEVLRLCETRTEPPRDPNGPKQAPEPQTTKD